VLPLPDSASRANATSRALLEAVLGVLLQAAPDDAVERRGHAARGRDTLRRVLLQERRQGLRARLPAEGPGPREHLVENDPRREDVRARVGGMAPGLLGEEVAHRPHQDPRGGGGRAGPPEARRERGLGHAGRAQELLEEDLSGVAFA
jgi:hypothetical protein